MENQIKEEKKVYILIRDDVPHNKILEYVAFAVTDMILDSIMFKDTSEIEHILADKFLNWYTNTIFAICSVTQQEFDRVLTESDENEYINTIDEVICFYPKTTYPEFFENFTRVNQL